MPGKLAIDDCHDPNQINLQGEIDMRAQLDPPSYDSLIFSRSGVRPQTQPLVSNAPVESGPGSPSVSYHPTNGGRRDVGIRLPATAGRQGQLGNNTQSNVQLNARHAGPANDLDQPASRSGDCPQTQPLVSNVPVESGQGFPSVSYHPTNGRHDVSIRLSSATARRQGQPGNNTHSTVQLDAQRARPANYLNLPCTKKVVMRLACAALLGLLFMVGSFGLFWYEKDQLLNNIHDSDKKNGTSLYALLTRDSIVSNINFAEGMFIVGFVFAAIGLCPFFYGTLDD